MSFELKAKRVRYSISASGWGPCVPACLILVLPEPFQGLVDLLRGDLMQTRVAERAELGQPAGSAGQWREEIGISRIGRAGRLFVTSVDDDRGGSEGRCQMGGSTDGPDMQIGNSQHRHQLFERELADQVKVAIGITQLCSGGSNPGFDDGRPAF